MKRQTIKTFRWLRDRILWEKFYYNRGSSIWDDVIKLITLSTVAGWFTTLLNTNFGTHISVKDAMAIIPFVMILYWISGRIDYFKFHLIQKENEIAMNANPALYDKIKAILKNTKKIKKSQRYEENRRVIFH